MQAVVCLHGVGEMGGLPSGLPVCRHTVGRLKLAMLLRHKVVALPWQTGVCCALHDLADAIGQLLACHLCSVLCLQALVLRPYNIWKSSCSESLSAGVLSIDITASVLGTTCFNASLPLESSAE